MTKFLNSPGKVFLLYAVVGLLAYFNALGGPFMFDDYAYFDAKIKHFDMGFQFDLKAPLGEAMVGARNAVWYRPMANLLLMGEYFCFRNTTFLYHAFGLGLWITAALMLRGFLLKFFPLEDQTAFWAGLLYLIHPINGVVVNYITASIYALQVIFMLLSLKPIHSRGVYGLNCVLSGVFFVLALMCHETALLLPLFAVAVLYAVNKDKFVEIVKKTAYLWAILVVYLGLRFFCARLTQYTVDNWGAFHMNGGEYVASLCKLGLWYGWQLISVSGIVLLKTVAVVREKAGLWILAGMALLGIAYALWRWNKNAAFRLGLLWFLIGFLILPAAALLQPANGLMIEPHWFVFSSAGFFIMLASLCNTHTLPGSVWVLVLVCIWLVGGWRLNNLWEDEQRYGNYWHQQSPSFMSLVFHMGQIYQKDKNERMGQYYDEIAFAHRWRMEIVAPSLAKIYLRQHKPDEALDLLRIAVEQKPELSNSREVLKCLSVAERMKNNLALAQKLWLRATTLKNPYD